MTARLLFALLLVLNVVLTVVSHGKARAAFALVRAPRPLARHALLVYGEVRTLRVGLASQLRLLAGTDGGLDIYAVLSPTTTHATRGTVPNAANDAIEVAWLRSVPNLRALRLLDVDHHDAFIAEHLPGFPWTTRESPYFKARNVVAASLKRKLAWQLMEAALTGTEHRYEVVVVSRPDIRVHEDQPQWPHGLDLSDFALGGSLRTLPGSEFVPGQPDSWAPQEAQAQRPMPVVFVNSFSEFDVKVSDMLGLGDWEAMYHYCHAVDYIRRLCAEEKGGPSNASPVEIDPGVLLGMGTLSGAREATRRARVTNASALARGIRFSSLRIHMCIGKEVGTFSLENNLSGCFDF